MIKLFVGVPGGGKTLAMQDLIRMLNRESRLGCAVLDRTSDWGLLDKDGKKNIRWRGDPPNIVELTPDAGDDSIRRALTDARDKGSTVVFKLFEAWQIGRWVQAIGDLVYCDDEIDLTARSKDWLLNPLRSFVHTGRHLPDEEGYPREVHILGACRRVQNIHTDLTEMADEVMIFRSQGKNTIKRMLDEGWISDEMVERVKTQPNLHYVKWESNGTTASGHLLPL